MVTMTEFAAAFGLDEKHDGTWTVLGKVTTVTASKLFVKVGNSSTAVAVERYCDAAVGDIVYIVIENGTARAIACRGGQSATVGQAYFAAIYSAGIPSRPGLYTLNFINAPSAFTEGMILAAYCGNANTYTGGAITLVLGNGGDGRVAKLFAHNAEVSSTNTFTWAAGDMLMLAYHKSGDDSYLYVVSKY